MAVTFLITDFSLSIEWHLNNGPKVRYSDHHLNNIQNKTLIQMMVWISDKSAYRQISLQTRLVYLNTVGIWKPTENWKHLKTGLFCFLFLNGKKTKWRPKPFANPTKMSGFRMTFQNRTIWWSHIFNHLNTGHVPFLDFHCIKVKKISWDYVYALADGQGLFTNDVLQIWPLSLFTTNKVV